MDRALSWLGSWGYGAQSRARKLACAIGLVVLPVAAPAEPVTVVAFGDSLTQGFGLVPEDGFVSQMGRWLTDQGADVEMRNAGVSGDTTAGGLARVDWSLTDDVDAMILALGANDVLRGLDPAAARQNLYGILQAATSREIPVLLVGVVAPSNYGPEYKDAFDSMYPELATEFGILYERDFLDGILSLPDRTEAFQLYVQPDGLHPNADGVALIVEKIGPKVLELVGTAR